VLVGIRGIESKGVRVAQAVAGAICDIGLNLPADFDVNYLKRGNVLCDPKYAIPVV
jgi:selenocysteine-specific translation elongation factor